MLEAHPDKADVIFYKDRYDIVHKGEKSAILDITNLELAHLIVQDFKDYYDSDGKKTTHWREKPGSRYLSGRLTRMNSATWSVLAPHLTPLMPMPKNTPEELPSLPPPRSIFKKILYDDGISDEERVKFLRLLVEPEELQRRD